MLLDIVFLPPAKLRNKISNAILKAIKGVPATFVVDNKRLIPHMSLFHIRTSKKKLPELTKRVKDIIKNYPAFKVKFDKIGIYGHSVSFYFRKNAYLKRLNKEVLASLYPLRTGLTPWNLSRKPNKKENELRKKYGTTLNVDDKSFHPHFTLAHLRNPKDTAGLAEKIQINAKQLDFIADIVAIAEVNSWHQVTKIIKTFSARGGSASGGKLK